MNRIIFNRFLWLLMLCSLLFVLLLLRLAQIQLVHTESFSSRNINLIKKSIEQRQQQIILHSGRGEITDRNGQALTGKLTHVLVLFPLSNKYEVNEEKLEKVAQIAKIDRHLLKSEIQRLKEPTIYRSSSQILQLTEEKAEQINELGIPGILGLPYEIRYDPQTILAQHFVGYIGQNPEYIKKYMAEDLAQGNLKENSVIGITGLEKTFQPFLQGVGPSSLNYYVDAYGSPLQGMDIKYIEQGNPFYPLVVRTTLEKDLQAFVETTLAKHQVHEGAVIILDTETSEILAVASRPNFMEQVEPVYSFKNKAFQRVAPGSIFKIVIAAAALEKELVQPKQKFECTGSVEGTHFHCWKQAGHGRITFEEAFAQSCNVVFGQLAQQLGPDLIEEYAAKLGLLELNGWSQSIFHLPHFKQLDGEEQGQVFAKERAQAERKDPQLLLSVGIGQLDVQVTPLAVANMLATITKGGNRHQVKGVRDILYQTGGTFYHFERKKLAGPEISPYTAYQLQKLMAGVVQSGTASQLKNKEWRAAGKTGTAQVMSPNMTSNQYVKDHQWFAGYYPVQNPKYAIVVLALNQNINAKNSAIDIFSEIVDWMVQQ